MRLVVLQPAYLPWLGYFDQMRAADLFLHLDDVAFDKNGWRNRNRVKTPQGVRWLTVPVLHETGPGLDAIRVKPEPWARRHLETIRQSYGRAAHAEAYLPGIAEVLSRPWDRLVDLDLALVDHLRGVLGIDTPTRRTSEFPVPADKNLRLLELCRSVGATEYLSGDAARDYLDLGAFRAANIRVRFHDYAHPGYRQLHGPFVPYLSVVDLLLNEGPRSLEILSRTPPE